MSSGLDLWDQQPAVIQTLGRAIKHDRVHQGYVLVGSQRSHTAKIARAFAQKLLCADPAKKDSEGACGECLTCRKIEGGNYPDLIDLRPGENQIISVDAIRKLAPKLGLRTVESNLSVVIIQDADGMNPAAQNALLRTLEEPPGPTCFLLTTPRYRALLPTLRSRCQTLRLVPVIDEFQPLTEAGMTPKMVEALSRLAGGDLERALTWQEIGASEVYEQLQTALKPQADTGDILSVAADLGRDRVRADLALAWLEVEVRDRLAHRHLSGGPLGPEPGLVNAADRLMEARTLQPFHPNRTLILESIFFELQQGSTQVPTPRSSAP